MQDRAIQAHTKEIATYVAIVVRNAMEDFHREHLSDKQMGELNPIIRNAIFTALYARETATLLPRSKEFVRSQAMHIPSYWEEPEFLDGFLPQTGHEAGVGDGKG
ncbi:MAG: hypothetical protein ISS72_06835 [Candidatus Brocadiae bacterium]|nr:hypothetical protein [Candidatus Brocadiia bacterium]